MNADCLCGGIRIEVSGKVGPVVYCHCSRCRKASGTAFAANADVRRKYWKFLAGEDLIREFESSRGVFRAFCRRCGSPIYSRRPDAPDVLRLRLGILNDNPDRRSLAHFWVGSKAVWFEIADALPQFAGGPSEHEQGLATVLTGRRRSSTVEGRPDLTTIRRCYAEELRAVTDLRSGALVEAFATVPRERFLGVGPWQILTSAELGHVKYRTTPDADPRHLYHNVLVAIDADRLLNNGLPSGLAGWFDALDLQAGDTVVHVGCGTGYYTAILAEVVGPQGRVVGIEIDPELARLARDNLSYLNQVVVFEGDGGALDPGAADAIFVNGGATHPRSMWIDSLRPNGRLLLPITASPDAAGLGWGGMFMITNRDGSFEARFVSEVGIFPCLGARDADLNRQLSSKDRRGWRSVRSLRRDPHEPHDTCWLHTREGCLSHEPLRSGAV